MPRTILQELTASNPPVNAQYVPISGNTTSDKWLTFTSWRPWVDFTYRNLSSIYRDALDLESQAPDLGPGPTLPIEQTIRDERSMDHYLSRFIIPIVNWALHQSSPVLGLIRLQIAPGSWVDYSDWALVSQDDLEENGVYRNLAPGDTKLSRKWRPDMYNSVDDYVRKQWSLPVSQVGTYAHNASTRYGFIITDAHLVVLRLTRESIAPGAALGRPQRQQQQQVHGRHSSHNSDLSFMSSQFSAMSITHSSYDDATSNSVEYQPLEYAVIDWGTHGEGRLTIKLALFCLCLMAARDGSIQTSYPPLDSWRQHKNGYIHNTTGLFKDSISRSDKLFNPESEPSLTPGPPASGSSSHKQASTSEHDDTVQDNITVDYGNAPAPYGAPGYAPSSLGPAG